LDHDLIIGPFANPGKAGPVLSMWFMVGIGTMAADKGWSFVAFETPGRGEPSKDGLSVPPLGPYLYPTAHKKTAPVLSIAGAANRVRGFLPAGDY